MFRALIPAFVALAATCLLACGGASTGDACTRDTDCSSGQVCLTNQPGGFCGKPCSLQGARGEECPSGTICAAHGGPIVCSPTCEKQSDCRNQYQCNGVANSILKACGAPPIQ
jgi:hypothetical protein